MNIYVASKFDNKEAVRALFKRLEDDGHKITHDWTVKDAADVPHDKKERYLTECAMDDSDGVLAADLLIMLDVPGMVSANTELGIAIGAFVPVIVVNPEVANGRYKNIFYHLPQHPVMFNIVKTVDEAVAMVKQKQEWADKGRSMINDLVSSVLSVPSNN